MKTEFEINGLREASLVPQTRLGRSLHGLCASGEAKGELCLLMVHLFFLSFFVVNGNMSRFLSLSLSLGKRKWERRRCDNIREEKRRVEYPFTNNNNNIREARERGYIVVVNNLILV